MLIYVQLFGTGVSRTLPVDTRAEATIGDLQKRILTLNPGIIIKRCIFAGKQLDDVNKTIGQPIFISWGFFGLALPLHASLWP